MKLSVLHKSFWRIKLLFIEKEKTSETSLGLGLGQGYKNRDKEFILQSVKFEMTITTGGIEFGVTISPLRFKFTNLSAKSF